LRWAQQHGATIVLHSPYARYTEPPVEFLKTQSLIGDVLKREHNQGLDPLIWETPYGSAGLLDDVEAAGVDSSAGLPDHIEAARFFGTTWERSSPVASLPWIVQSDAYGQLVLPAYLDSISASSPPTVQQQLNTARTLLMCRGCVATGFLPIPTVSLESVERYVDGLRAMGYVFMDPRMFARAPGNSADAYALAQPQKRLSTGLTEARVP
jgi:hypothetical protein